MLIRPYGDLPGDGAIQLSFTLPLPAGPRAQAAAEALCRGLGLEQVQVVCQERLGPAHTFLVVYARTTFELDPEALEVHEPELPSWSREELDQRVQERFGRPLVVVGACIGNDAHTVGLDAILNAKGCQGIPGLERYAAFRIHNLGSQVPPEVLVESALALKADAILVSQVVTQRNVHLQNLRQLAEALAAAERRNSMVVLAGGPRMDHRTTLELGFDAGFGAGTTPEEVACCIVHLLEQRQAVSSQNPDPGARP